MTYSSGSDIEAIDYTTFATLAGGINEIYADDNPGATALPAAGFGYGQPALSAVSAGADITAAEWDGLFTAMRGCGTHQGTVVVPPLPVSGPVPGDDVAAVTDDVTFNSLLSNLNTNRFLIDAGQTSLIAGTTYPSAAAWTTSLTYTYSVDLGSWDNARYFFNSGGATLLEGGYSSAATPDELAWQNALAEMSPLKFTYNDTQPGTGGNDIVTPPGFYGLTTVYQDIYEKYVGGGVGPYYATNFIRVSAKLAAAPGTNGIIDFRIVLTDGDTFPVVKTGTTSYRSDSLRSSGAIVYPGTLSVVSGGFVAV